MTDWINNPPKIYPVFNEYNEKIGEVYKEEYGWVSYSYACERYSGGLQGHDCIDTKKEAIEDVRDMDRDYRPVKRRRVK